MNTPEKMRDKNVLLKGFPEIRIIQLVRRAHSAKECSHKGNCLTEEKMVSQLSELLESYFSSLLQEKREVVEKMIEASRHWEESYPTSHCNDCVEAGKCKVNATLDHVLAIFEEKNN